MRKLKRLFAISWSQTLQYRGDLMLWLVAITATPLLSLAIWHATARAGTGPLSAENILTYYLLVMIVRVAASSFSGFRLIQQILNGEIVSYLIRPPAILWTYVTTQLTTKALQVLPLLALFIVILIAWPNAIDTSTFNPERIGLFAISLAIAYLISFSLDISMGLLAFWLEEAQELMAYRFLLTQVASGVLIPFALMPGWLHTAFSFLPFRYTLSAPIEILMGQVDGIDVVTLLLIQAAWAIGFIVIVRTLYVRGLKRYAIPGQ